MGRRPSDLHTSTNSGIGLATSPSLDQYHQPVESIKPEKKEDETTETNKAAAGGVATFAD